jgi:malate dehydrogenase
MIGIIGSGNVGANTAFFIAEKGVGDVSLFDIQDGLSTGKALDMMEAAPIRGYRTHIRGVQKIEEVLDNEVIIITAGAVRKPGTDREDLFNVNRNIIMQIAQDLPRTRSKFIIVTEPVDLLTTVFAEASRLPPSRIMGLGGMLDSTRLRYLISRELSVSPENVAAVVVGRHSDAMIPLIRYCCVAGVPISHLLEEKTLDKIVEETRGAGGLIVDMAQRASAYYGPSAVAAELAETICHDTRRIHSVSILMQGQYGIENVAMSLPAIVGSGGVHRVLEPRLTDAEKKALASSAEEMKTILKRIPEKSAGKAEGGQGES